MQLLASDVVYAVQIKNQPGYLYVLSEHQRNPDKLMRFRLMKYTWALMDKHLKQHPNIQELPLVVPLVFYHGRAPYPFSTDIKDLITAPRSLVDAMLFQPFTLIDTHTLSDEQLQQRYWAGLMQLIFKHIDDADILNWLPQQLALFTQVDKEGGIDFIASLVRYAFEVANTQKPQVVVKLLIEQLSTSSRDTLMTIAEQLRQQGKTEGKAEGEILGLKMLQRLIQLKFGAISAEHQAKMTQADADTLLKWSDKVLTASSESDIFNDN